MGPLPFSKQLRPLFFNTFSACGFGPAFAVCIDMILLIWSSERAPDCARLIEDTFQQRVQVAATLHDGCEHLRLEDYAAVLVDQWITEADPGRLTIYFITWEPPSRYS